MYPICPIYLNSIYQWNAYQEYLRNSMYGQPTLMTPMAPPQPQDSVNLEVQGKKIEIMNSKSLNTELNQALLNPTEFQAFKKNPKQYLKNYNLNIDEDLSMKLTSQLGDFQSIEEISPQDPVAATAWAVALAMYSVTTTKVAVAF